MYVADLLVGVVVNVALVGMLAPYVRIGKPSVSKGFPGRMQHAYGALPSRSAFSAKNSSSLFFMCNFFFPPMFILFALINVVPMPIQLKCMSLK